MEKLKLVVCISGTGSNLKALHKASLDPKFPAKIVLVVSNKPQAPGVVRSQKAKLNTIVIDEKKYISQSSFEGKLNEVILLAGGELVCLAGFMRLLSGEFCRQWNNKLINIHPSILPAFKGLNAQEKSLRAGVKFSGCTVHFVREKMDTGPIIIQAIIPILQNDTLKSLTEKILEQEHKIFKEAVQLIANKQITIENEKVIINQYACEPTYLINPSIKTR